MKIKEFNAVEEYQCSGCVVGSDIKCGKFKEADFGIGCGSHWAGTTGFPFVGTFFLGLPNGFNRIGLIPQDHFRITIFKSFEDMLGSGWKYDMFNVPVWKHKNKNGHILVRGLSPRTNRPFLHIILDSKGFEEIQCIEISQKEIEEID